jgi:hypothetical protein
MIRGPCTGQGAKIMKYRVLIEQGEDGLFIARRETVPP